MAQASPRTLHTSLNKLQISPKPKKASPADSWDDEEEDDNSPDSTGTATPIRPVSSSDYPGPPPPTPSSPSFSSRSTAAGTPYQTFPPYGFQGDDEDESIPTRSSASAVGRAGAGDERRPEKSTAVASRLIAAGIGQKAPRRTKEQREYDQAMKVQEKKRRDQAKSEEERKREEKERAKRAIWDD
ncbi:hypothetical protein B0A55_12469 [Friedmanniomyces simplex]|uniref:Uncharacterized protein n=1 Tax=Friedmanniomyces simplex TaxID=329884 RepID=A0A4U0WJU5_9PEZI|nr:hypothetical protein B0A55_12469 [Friedmanniomyces simplex]